MSTPEHGSVTTWFRQLKQEDREAAQRLWARYFEPLVVAARKKLGSAPRRVADEEDIAVSVFASLCRRKEDFPYVANRGELWRILLTLTNQKVADNHRWYFAKKRGGGKVRGESALEKENPLSEQAIGLAQYAGREPTAEFVVQLEDSFQHVLFQLPEDNKLREVAVLALEGYSNQDIAAKLGMTDRSVRRKKSLIREIWEREIGDD